MWKCISFLIVVAQCIIVAPHLVETDETTRMTHDAVECCPCEFMSDQRKAETRSADCPCQSADNDGASSMFSPVRSAERPLRPSSHMDAREPEPKDDLKPLLDPEVGLASSVLETLKQATEEEYQDALARDALRSSENDEIPEESAHKTVTIIVHPNSRSVHPDLLHEPSNYQETRFVQPSLGNIDILDSARNKESRANTIQDTLTLQNRNNLLGRLRSVTNPLHNFLQNSHAWLENKEKFRTAEDEDNNLPLTSIPKPSLRRVNIIKTPLNNIDNILNRKDVEILSPSKSNVAKVQKGIGIDKIQEAENNDKSGAFSNNLDVQYNNANPVASTKYAKTEILDTIPILSESSTDKSIYKPSTNLLHNTDQLDPLNICKNGESIGQNSAIEETRIKYSQKNRNNMLNPTSDKNKARSESDLFERESHNYYNHKNINSVDLKNGQNLRNAHSNEDEYLEAKEDSGLPTTTHDILRTLENYKRVNGITQHGKKTNSINMLGFDDQRRESQIKEIIDNEKHFPLDTTSNEQSRSSLPLKAENKLNLEDLQKMSNKILLHYDNQQMGKAAKEFETIPRGNPATEGKTKSSQRLSSSINNLLHQDQPKANIESDLEGYDQPDDSKFTKVAESNTCLVQPDEYLDSNRNVNEMHSAASEPRTRYYEPISYLQRNSELNSNDDKSSYDTMQADNSNRESIIDRNLPFKYTKPLMRRLEDVNLDIFQFQRPLGGNREAENVYSPRLNVNSFKTKLDVSEYYKNNPVKLHKSFRTGSDILGATLTINPEKNTLNKEKIQTKSASDIISRRVEELPNIDDLRSFVQNNIPDILNLPRDSGSKLVDYVAGINVGDISKRILHGSKNSMRNIQHTLGDTHRNAHERGQSILRTSLLNDNGLMDSVSRAQEDFKDKLESLNKDLYDRIHSFRRNLLETTRPQFVRSREHTQNRITNGRNLKSTNSKSPIQTVNRRVAISRSTPKTRPTLAKNPSPQNSVPRSNSNINKHVKSNDRAKLFTNPNRLQILQERLKVPSGKKVISTRTTEKPFTVDRTNKSWLPPRHLSLLQKKLEPPKVPQVKIPLSERRSANKNSELTSSPSEVIYSKTPRVSDTNIPNERFSEKPHSQDALMKTFERQPKNLLPKIAENVFLSKVKEAVSNQNAKSRFPHSRDTESAASVVELSEPLKENVSYKCKMVCGKEI